MSIAAAIRTLHHYVHSIEFRTELLSEVFRAKRMGFVLPSGVMGEVWRSPALLEAMIRFLRFIDPQETVLLLDVGANTGYWCSLFRSFFPRTVTHAFEPVSETYGQLQHRFAGDASVITHHVGLSDAKEKVQINLGELSTMSSLHLLRCECS